MAAYTGARSGELMALRVRHLNVLHKTIRIQDSVTDVSDVDGQLKRRLSIGKPKTKTSKRTLELSSFVVNLLQQEAEGKTPDDFIFGTDKPARHSNFTRRHFKPAVSRLVADGRWPKELERLRFHDLRHTAAALMIANDEHPKAVQERLGHSSITITMDRYGKLYPGHGTKIADRLEKTFQTAADMASVTAIGRTK